jgi:sugar O-acyltransferase (sialic acid O-acetyltransferase NeuD family)
MKKVIVYGSLVLAKMLFYDARGNEDFQIACFTMDEGYRGGDELLGLPWVSYDRILELYPPDQYDMLALFDGYRSMRARDRIFHKAKNSGYQLRNYISARADVTPEISMGINNVIMGATHIGFGGRMGDNNLIRQNVYLGHEFTLGNNNIITAGCTIGGHCTFENSSFIGLGVTILNRIHIAQETLVGGGSVVIRDTEPYSKNVGNPSRVISYHHEQGPGMILPGE